MVKGYRTNTLDVAGRVVVKAYRTNTLDVAGRVAVKAYNRTKSI